MNFNGRRVRGDSVFEHAGQSYRVDQLEHFGDSVVSLAARLLAHECNGLDWHRYVLHYNKLITNSNFRSCPGYERNPDGFEITIGQEFILSGIEAAIDTAKAMLMQTDAWTGHVTWPVLKTDPKPLPAAQPKPLKKTCPKLDRNLENRAWQPLEFHVMLPNCVGFLTKCGQRVYYGEDYRRLKERGLVK